MSFPLDIFPDDDYVRQIVSIDGIESVAKRSDERRYKVRLETPWRMVSIRNVSSQYLWVLGMGSVWRGQKPIGLRCLPAPTKILLNDDNPIFIWKNGYFEGFSSFLTEISAGKDRSSKYPAYQLIHGFNGDDPVILCISSSELKRFFIGRSPALSRHLFGFSDELTNPRLFRYEGDSFLKGTPTRIEIVDKSLGKRGRQLLISLLTDEIGKKQILSAARSARSAVIRNRYSRSNKDKHVFPIFGLPYVASDALSVIGRMRIIHVEAGDRHLYLSVLAVKGIDGDRPAAIQKSLLLDDPALPDLLLCQPEIALGQTDISHYDDDEVPDELALLVGCIVGTSSGIGPEWVKGFLGNIPEKSGVPLIDLSRLKKKAARLDNGKSRKAIVGILENERYRIILIDLERSHKKEPIGIFTFLAPINAPIDWAQLSYIIEHRLTPKIQGGAWPSNLSHGGGYVAKVQKHRKFRDEENELGMIVHKFVGKLVDQACHSNNLIHPW